MMNNKFLLSPIFALAIGLSSHVKAQNNEETFTAQCRIQNDSDKTTGSDFFNVYYNQELIRIYRPFQGSYVIIGEGNQELKVDAIFRMDTWITYRASFEYKTEKVHISFSNHLSPSLGKMYFPDGQIKFVACELVRRNQ